MINGNTSYKGVQWFPGLDISYILIDKFKIYATLNRSLRLPTFTDLYYSNPSANEYGNPSLNPETAWTIESGLKYVGKGIVGNLSVIFTAMHKM